MSLRLAASQPREVEPVSQVPVEALRDMHGLIRDGLGWYQLSTRYRLSDKVHTIRASNLPSTHPLPRPVILNVLNEELG